jgi:hypothetical protein
MSGQPVSKPGRPGADEATFIAWVCGSYFERITGRPDTITKNPITLEASGEFYNLVKTVFRALNLSDDPENRARAERELRLRAK